MGDNVDRWLPALSISIPLYAIRARLIYAGTHGRVVGPTLFLIYYWQPSVPFDRGVLKGEALDADTISSGNATHWNEGERNVPAICHFRRLIVAQRIGTVCGRMNVTWLNRMVEFYLRFLSHMDWKMRQSRSTDH